MRRLECTTHQGKVMSYEFESEQSQPLSVAYDEDSGTDNDPLTNYYRSAGYYRHFKTTVYKTQYQFSLHIQ